MIGGFGSRKVETSSSKDNFRIYMYLTLNLWSSMILRSRPIFTSSTYVLYSKSHVYNVHGRLGFSKLGKIKDDP
jgi:hypothetical protein